MTAHGGKSEVGWSSCCGRAGERQVIGALKDITPKAVRDLPSLQPAQDFILDGVVHARSRASHY